MESEIDLLPSITDMDIDLCYKSEPVPARNCDLEVNWYCGDFICRSCGSYNWQEQSVVTLCPWKHQSVIFICQLFEQSVLCYDNRSVLLSDQAQFFLSFFGFNWSQRCKKKMSSLYASIESFFFIGVLLVFYIGYFYTWGWILNFLFIICHKKIFSNLSRFCIV